jgi:hypothetical protein
LLPPLRSISAIAFRLSVPVANPDPASKEISISRLSRYAALAFVYAAPSARLEIGVSILAATSGVQMLPSARLEIVASRLSRLFALATVNRDSNANNGPKDISTSAVCGFYF